MRTAKRLGLIGAGYALALVAGAAAVALNELSMTEEATQGSPGMVAFGDVIIFVPAAGVIGLIPALFLLKLFVAKAPRALIIIELLVAVLGPLSWLAVMWLAGGPDPMQPHAIGQILGVFAALIGIPCIVLGPVVLVIEGLTFILIRARGARLLLAVAALMDIIPIGLYAWHMSHVPHY